MRRIVLLFAIIFQSMVSLSQTGEDAELDSLISLYHDMSYNDTNKVLICKDIAYLHYNVDSTIMWSERLIALADRHKMPNYKGRGLHFMSWAYYYKEKFDKSMEICYEGINLAQSINNYKNLGDHYRILSSNFVNLKDFKAGINAIDSAKYYFGLLNDSVSYNNMNTELYRLYYELRAFSAADSILDISLKFNTAINNTDNIISDLRSKAENCVNEYELFYGASDISLIMRSKYYSNLTFKLKFNDISDCASSCHWLVRSLFHELDYYNYEGKRRQDILDSMYAFCIRETDIVKKVDMSYAKTYLSFSWLYYYLSSRDYARSKQTLDSLLSAHDDYDNWIYLLYHIYYTKVNDYDNALLYSAKYSKCILQRLSPMDVVNCTKHQAQKDFEAERDRMKLAEAERLFRMRAYYMAAIALAVLAALFLLYRYIRKRKHFNELNEMNQQILLQNEEINQQKEEILTQRDVLFEKNRLITDSINYAKNIQSASLPKDELMTSLFGDYFLIYRPLNIVAGDFYWAKKVGRYNVLVCADCTGHGVPGAFVSMLGISLFNEVATNLSGEIKASQILDSVRGKLMNALGQDKNLYERGQRINMDGMDLAMVMIDYENMTLQYAGAYRPLWIWRDGDIIQHKPDKMPIGIYLGEHRHFTNHDIEISKGDVLYMFSDGIPDQFGYEDDSHTSCKHFSTKKLLSLLSEIGGLPTDEQKSIIENEVDTWRNGYKQLDDNILVGVRI